MALSITAGAKPAFLSRNWINQDSIDYGTFTATEMDLILERIIDGDPLSYWAGSSATDGTEVTITISLQQKESNVGRDIDLLLFQNINWKNFIVEYSTTGPSGSWSTFTGGNYSVGVADYADDDLALAPVAQITGVKALRVRITHTQTPNEDKKLGGWIAAELEIQMSRGDMREEDNYRENVNTIELGNKNESDEYIMRSAQSYLWWGRTVEFKSITKAELATLFALKTAGLPFVYYPKPGDDARACYLCKFGPGWSPKPTSMIPSPGMDIAFPLREVYA